MKKQLDQCMTLPFYIGNMQRIFRCKWILNYQGLLFMENVEQHYHYADARNIIYF